MWVSSSGPRLGLRTVDGNVDLRVSRVYTGVVDSRSPISYGLLTSRQRLLL
jgi:hypothetical protein